MGSFKSKIRRFAGTLDSNKFDGLWGQFNEIQGSSSKIGGATKSRQVLVVVVVVAVALLPCTIETNPGYWEAPTDEGDSADSKKFKHLWRMFTCNQCNGSKIEGGSKFDEFWSNKNRRFLWLLLLLLLLSFLVLPKRIDGIG